MLDDFISEKIQREKIEQLTAAKIINIFPSFIEELLSWTVKLCGFSFIWEYTVRKLRRETTLSE